MSYKLSVYSIRINFRGIDRELQFSHDTYHNPINMIKYIIRISITIISMVNALISLPRMTLFPLYNYMKVKISVEVTARFRVMFSQVIG